MKRFLFTALTALALPSLAGAAALEQLPGETVLASIPAPIPAIPARQSARPLVCVDPGHPNTFNDGFAPVNGTNETRINWQVALRLESVLKAKGFDVLLTRHAEREFVENKDRARICNNGAVLAVHLHCESTPGTGFALYYPDRQGVYDYKNDPENGFKGPSELVRTDSRSLAMVLANGMGGTLEGALKNRGVYGDSRTAVGSSQGALTFSIFSNIPTVTIEMVVLTNKKDAAFIKAEAGQQQMAQAIAAGIVSYTAR